MKKSTLVLLLFICCVISSYAQWTQTNLPTYLDMMGSASLGSKVYFAGGQNNFGLAQSGVNIYDVNTGQWTSANLSIARVLPVGVSAGNKVIFAGGFTGNYVSSSRVDIYDVLSKEWTTAELSYPRFDVGAVRYGDKVFFAGGANLTGMGGDILDIYNVTTGVWTTGSLSGANSNVTLTGTKAIFAGDRVMDIYDFITDTWSTATFPSPREWMGVTSVGDKAIFAGGLYPGDINTDRVDIYDVSTGLWTISNLSSPRAFMKNNAVTACGKAFFTCSGTWAGSTIGWTSNTDKVDIYDPATNTWAIEVATRERVQHAGVANGNKVFIAGGSNWVTYTFTSVVDIYTCLTDGIEEHVFQKASLNFYPNPANNFITIETKLTSQKTFVSIYNISGPKISEQQITNPKTQIDISNLPTGVYVIKLQNEKMVEVGKLVKE